MNIEDLVGGLISQAGSGNLSSGVSSVLSSLGSQEVGNLVNGSAQEMNSDQRGQLVSSLLGGLSNSGVDVQSLLSQLGVGQNVADNPEEATPDEVAAISQHAHENHPGIFEKAMSVYEEHPTLIKTLGTVAVAAIAKHVYDNNQS